MIVVTAPAWGQRARFPSQVPAISTSQPPGTNFGPAPVTQVPTTPAPAIPGPGIPAPATGVPSLQGPPATFGGTLQSPPGWDPYNPAASAPQTGQPYYAAPTPAGPIGPFGPQPPPALFPGGVPRRQSPGTYLYSQPNGTLGEWKRFLKETRFEYAWLAGDGSVDHFDVNTVELNATFAIPFFYNTEAPLLVTPGFAIHYFEGPVSVGQDLPPRVYDAYLDLAWQPLITQWLSADLGVRTGLYTDFEEFNSNTIRIMGRSLAVLAFTPTTQVALGVVYLDRNRVKLLPSGGIIWRPNADARYDILFPNPKLARRLRDIGTLELWWYAAGEYGGGSWTVQRIAAPSDEIDYNDIRVILGLEWVTQGGLRGHFEIGYVFEREIIFARSATPDFIPDETVMVRGGLAY